MNQPQHLPLQGLNTELPDNDLAAQYCALLLQSLGATTQLKLPLPSPEQAIINCVQDWADSGLIPLTGKPNEMPLQGPGCLPSCARGALNAIRLVSKKNILPDVNGATLLSERAAALKLIRQGTISPNGSCHLFATQDGWIAINLAREDDWRLLPALLETECDINNLLELQKLLKQQDSAVLVDRGGMMGLPIAHTNNNKIADNWMSKICSSPSVDRNKQEKPLVIDLSSLWAGPLCSHLIQAAGARVIKVESTTRLDGARQDEARQGVAEFFDLLHAGKSSIVLNLHEASGQQQLQQLLCKANMVIEGSRPRALKQMGIDAEKIVKQTPGLIWLSITGYGREEPYANKVAFGDDAAVASGLAAATAEPPLFCGDAIGDPLTGLHAAFAALAYWQAGMGGLLDLSLCNTTQFCLQFAKDSLYTRGVVTGEENNWQLNIAEKTIPVKPPQTRRATGKAAKPGADTQAVLLEFDV